MITSLLFEAKCFKKHEDLQISNQTNMDNFQPLEAMKGPFIASSGCKSGLTHIPANMRRWPNVGLLLAHSLRRWPSIKPTLGQITSHVCWDAGQRQENRCAVNRWDLSFNVFNDLNDSNWKLEMNFDFSSNNNIWARFYQLLWPPFRILLGYFNHERSIRISRVSFLAAIVNWNFKLRTTDFKFQKSPWSFWTFQYIYICLSNGIAFRAPRTHIDASPTLKQHWLNFCVWIELQLLL